MRVAVLFVPLLLLSGCFVEKGADTDDVASDVDGATAKGNGTATLGKAPVLGNVTLNVTGLAVAFTILGSDADNDTVTYVIAFGDNASANGTLARGAVTNASAVPTASGLVATVNHTYAAAGDYNATVTLSDGKSSVNRTVLVTVANATASGPPMEPLTVSGSCTMPDSGFHEFEVLAGQAFIHGVLSPGITAVDLDWYLYDPSGAEKASGGAFDPVDGGEPDLEVDAPVAGLWSIEVNCFVGAAASYDFTLTFN